MHIPNGKSTKMTYISPVNTAIPASQGLQREKMKRFTGVLGEERRVVYPSIRGEGAVSGGPANAVMVDSLSIPGSDPCSYPLANSPSDFHQLERSPPSRTTICSV